MTTQLELATIRAQLMDKYNNVMAEYFYNRHISDEKQQDKIHDKNVLKVDIITDKYMFASYMVDKETHISNLLEIYNKLDKEGPKHVLKFCQFILYIISQIDECVEELAKKYEEGGFVYV